MTRVDMLMPYFKNLGQHKTKTFIKIYIYFLKNIKKIYIKENDLVHQYI